jgi:hypothetical protein
MAKGKSVYLTAKEHSLAVAVFEKLEETLNKQIVYDETLYEKGWNEVKKDYDLVCGIRDKLTLKARSRT